mmetsp:Transcript_33204/g.51692  ORF Transcript_33204/g.51692 Transcript_33204/m.51692 type:complete len:238 (-) Transcript_33204:1158-1871(-)
MEIYSSLHSAIPSLSFWYEALNFHGHLNIRKRLLPCGLNTGIPLSAQRSLKGPIKRIQHDFEVFFSDTVFCVTLAHCFQDWLQLVDVDLLGNHLPNCVDYCSSMPLEGRVLLHWLEISVLEQHQRRRSNLHHSHKENHSLLLQIFFYDLPSAMYQSCFLFLCQFLLRLLPCNLFLGLKQSRFHYFLDCFVCLCPSLLHLSCPLCSQLLFQRPEQCLTYNREVLLLHAVCRMASPKFL